MDFLTAFPYWGIIVLIIFNAILVNKRTVEVEESDHQVEH